MRWKDIVVPVKVTLIKVKPKTRSMRRFDLTVEGNHTYFADGIAVHNSPETTTGGRALKFYSSVRLELRAIGDKLKDGENIYGQRVKVKVLKNKIGPPFRTTEYDLVFGHGTDIHADLLDTCIGRGIVTGDSWLSYHSQNIGQGRRNAILTLKSNPALSYAMYDELLTAVQDERGFLPDGTPIPGRVQEVILPTQA